MIEEMWKDIPGFDYEISNLGRCRGKERYVKVGGNGKRLLKSRIIKPAKCTNGYLEYVIPPKGSPNTKKALLAHRLVAQAFIPNPDNKREVNHLDEDITNNVADNLRWVTPKENCNYGNRNLKCRESQRKHFKKVSQYTKDGVFIKEYETLSDAAKEVNVLPENISRAARNKGNRKYAAGYMWKFIE